MDRGRHPVDVPIAWPPPAGDQTYPSGPPAGGELGLAGGLLRADPVVLQHPCLRAAPLRAIGAVLRTEPTFHVHQEIELHAVGEEGPTDTGGGRHYIEQFSVARAEHGQGLLAAGTTPVQGARGDVIEPSRRHIQVRPFLAFRSPWRVVPTKAHRRLAFDRVHSKAPSRSRPYLASTKEPEGHKGEMRYRIRR